REGGGRAPGGERQTVRDRKLPGWLGHHDGRGASPEIVRAYHHRRSAAFLLGRRAWEKPHALFRRFAGRQLADRLHKRPRPRQVRRRLAAAEFREPKSGQYAVEQTI